MDGGSTLAPGIYFGLEESTYHAVPALSASGIKNLLISPLDFWVASPFNPDYEDRKTDAMIAGTAFHRRLLEPARFAELYAPVPSKDDYPDAIDGAADLKAECDRLGLKKSGTIGDLCARILDAEPAAQLWPVIRADLLAQSEGRTLLKREVLSDIERAARIVFAHQSAAKALTGGYPEVSIFWTDEETGVPMKARADYLKVRAIVDIKTFSNSLGRPIDAAVAAAVANERHHVQAVVYSAAVAAAKEMLLRDKSTAIHNLGNDQIPDEWLIQFAACRDHAFTFVFIEQGAVTNVKVREFRRVETFAGMGATINAYWQAGHAGFREGVRRYAHFMKTLGPDRPWIEDEPMRPFTDQEMPLYMLG